MFASFSTSVVFDVRLDAEVAAGAARAHNRAMAEFCADEPRMIGVGATPLDDIDAAMAEVDHALELGLGAMWIPHRAPGGRSPGHDDLDRLWAKVAEAELPVLLHVGGHPLQIDKAFMNTGRPVPGDWLGGGENVRGKDMIGLHHAAELFVGTMVLDGVLERHRDLRVGVIELGAGWVPAMLRRLDQIAGIWKRSEPDLAALTRLPSEQLTEQAAFTPYPFEDVGAMIRDSNPDLYLFSSDYPHIEGGRDPLGRFTTSLRGFGADVDDEVLRRQHAPAALGCLTQSLRSLARGLARLTLSRFVRGSRTRSAHTQAAGSTSVAWATGSCSSASHCVGLDPASVRHSRAMWA